MGWNPQGCRRTRIFAIDPRLEVAETDTLVIGGGVAGYSAALAAAAHGRVLVIAKDSMRESNSDYAQGGVAAVLGEEDTHSAHVEDTLTVGSGVCERAAVDIVVSEGPKRVRELISWGGRFDSEAGRLQLALEGGHSQRRVVHAKDETGAEVQRTLVSQIRAHANITVWEFTFAIDLDVDDLGCTGALVLRDRRDVVRVRARSTILCTGGSGRLYRETTNPDIATGDGVAMAFRAGARIRDVEFVQFHPTTLYVAGSARHLITEAVRGEGGHLVDEKGERFTFRYHPAGELAPRDVVSRAIVSHLASTGGSCVYLSLAHLGDRVHKLFPGISRTLTPFRLDLAKDRIPVLPSAHYHVGGVEADLSGRTSIPRLFAAGEVASSGLHGANRLASNSLLEGLVFGRRAGELAGADGGELRESAEGDSSPQRDLPGSVLHVGDMTNSIRSLMWRAVGIMRNQESLEAARSRLASWNDYVSQVDFKDARGFELVNLLTVGLLVTEAAAWRHESRGTHFRTDWPEKDDVHFKAHSVQVIGQEIHAQPITG